MIASLDSLGGGTIVITQGHPTEGFQSKASNPGQRCDSRNQVNATLGHCAINSSQTAVLHRLLWVHLRCLPTQACCCILSASAERTDNRALLYNYYSVNSIILTFPPHHTISALWHRTGRGEVRKAGKGGAIVTRAGRRCRRMPPVKALVGLAAILSIACLLLLYLEPSPTRHISLFARNPADASPTYSSKTVGTGSQPAAEDADSNGAPHLGELTPPVIPLELAIHEPHFELGVLQKQANSSRLRLVFLVGLEGTGHHYMADVLENVCRRAHVACPKVCNLAKAMYPGIALPKTPYDYMVARGELRAEMEKLALTAESIPPNESTVVGFGPCRFEAGMMSYPNFNGDDKVLQYVDFKVVAEEAERARIDLRIIYLSRSAKDILISDTWHNHYSNS